MASVEQFLVRRLKLKINKAKSTVANEVLIEKLLSTKSITPT